MTLHLRFDDFTRVSRARTLPEPTAAHADVIAAARELFGAAAPLVARRGCTLLGLSLGNLAEAPAQLALPLDGGAEATDAAIDAVRDRFGAAKLTRATLLNRGPELVPPELALMPPPSRPRGAATAPPAPPPRRRPPRS